MGSNAVVSGIKLHKLYPFVLHHYTTPFKELVVDGSIDSLQLVDLWNLYVHLAVLNPYTVYPTTYMSYITDISYKTDINYNSVPNKTQGGVCMTSHLSLKLCYRPRWAGEVYDVC